MPLSHAPGHGQADFGQARGAGTLGHWLIKFVGWILGVAATVVSFYTLLTGHPPS